MMKSTIQYQTDILIINAYLEENIFKYAQDMSMFSGIFTKIIDYVKEHFREGHMVEDAVNFLQPVVLAKGLGLFMPGPFAFLAAILFSVFDIHLGSVIQSVWDTTIKPMITSGQKLTEQQVESAISQAVMQHDKPIEKTDSQMLEGLKRVEQVIGSLNVTQNYKTLNMIKLSIISNNNLIKNAADVKTPSSFKTKLLSIAASVLGKIFKTALVAAGFMVLVDMGKGMLGKSNPLTGPASPEQQTSSSSILPKHVPAQTKFKVNPSYSDVPHANRWIENYPNNENGISQMLVDFTKQVYPDTKDLDQKIKSTRVFQSLVSNIDWYNHSMSGSSIVFVPLKYGSKKQIVDYFIDEVAAAS